MRVSLQGTGAVWAGVNNRHVATLDVQPVEGDATLAYLAHELPDVLLPFLELLGRVEVKASVGRGIRLGPHI